MELIYTTRNTDFEQGKQYRNPQFFDRPEPAKSVVLEGDFPEVKAAYDAIGVPVKVLGQSKPEPTKKATRKKASADENVSDQG